MTAQQHFPAPDGLDLAYRELGTGRPLLLLHGLIADGLQWIQSGPAEALAAHGNRVILPDLRGHGASAHPPDPAHYPPDVLADDGLALVRHLGLTDAPGGWVLGGYSLGAQVALRMLARGARPARAVLGGQGLGVVTREGGNPVRRRALTALVDGNPPAAGTPEAQLAYWITRAGADPLAVRNVQDSLVATSAAALAAIPTPTLVLAGDRDDPASAAALADALPAARFTALPGDHFSTLGSPEFSAALLDFLDG